MGGGTGAPPHLSFSARLSPWVLRADPHAGRRIKHLRRRGPPRGRHRRWRWWPEARSSVEGRHTPVHLHRENWPSSSTILLATAASASPQLSSPKSPPWPSTTPY